ncbi:MAG: prepilin-type N-terminal cleavage/methylation domain-containing protein [Gemmatimonadota bacterium]
MMRPWRARRPGFTLIEVLVVVVLIGIVVTVSGTSVSKQLTRDRAVRAATVVEGMLVEATQVAVRRRVPIRIQGSGTALQIVERSTGTVIRSRSFGQGSDMEATLTLDPVAGVTIFPNGRASGDLSVTVTTDGAAFVVRRTATGIVRRP